MFFWVSTSVLTCIFSDVYFCSDVYYVFVSGVKYILVCSLIVLNIFLFAPTCSSVFVYGAEFVLEWCPMSLYTFL